MATHSMPLPAGAWIPTSDVSSWASAQLQVKQSSSGVPSPRWLEWLFDSATDEHIVIAFIVPTNFSSSPVLKIQFKMASATSGNVVWGCRVACVTPGDAVNVDADAFATTQVVAEAVPGTAGHLDEASITISNTDGMAAGDLCIMVLYRDANHASDTASGDAEFVAADFRYSD